MAIKEALSEIFTKYAQEKRILETLYRENRAFNKTLKEGGSSEVDKSDPRRIELIKYPIVSTIIRDLPNLIRESAEIPTRQYRIKGSVGNGNIAEVPWISVFDKDITDNATKGYYIVLLITADSQGAFLSFNQGCTQYFDYVRTIGKNRKEAYYMLRTNAAIAQKSLRSLYDFDLRPISLGATDELGFGYEAGNICSKFYSLNHLPSDADFINDLRNMLGVYRELKGLVGKDIMLIESLDSNENYQEKVQAGYKKELPAGPIKRRNSPASGKSNVIPRDPDIAYTALSSANFKCENDATHTTFISGRTGKNFVEAHHLVPMEFQDSYENSIDVPENIISLCPNCHRAFHSSEPTYKDALIKKFLLIRQSSLGQRGIILSADQLVGYYKAARLHTLKVSGEAVMTVAITASDLSKKSYEAQPGK